MIETIFISDLDSGFFNLQSAICNLKLAGFARWNLFYEFFLPGGCEVLFNHPILLCKGVLSFDEKPVLSCASSLHQNEGEAAF